MTYHDPHVPQFVYEELAMTSVADLKEALSGADCVVVATDHDLYDSELLQPQKRLVIDTRRSPR